jgi:hypothetical protein
MNTLTPINIRPMKLAELLDRAIRLYRQNFFTFIGIIAVPYIPLMLIQTGLAVFANVSMIDQLGTTPPDPENPFAMFNPAVIAASLGSIALIFVQFILVQGVASAALTRAVANNYTGKSVGILDSYRTLQNSWWRLILALIVIFFLVLFVVIWMIIPCIGWFTGPGILMFISLIVGPLVAPVIVLENGGIFQSIRRAWDLARSRFWWLVGYAVVITLFGQLIISGPVLLINFLIGFVTTMFPLDLNQQMVISALVQNLVTLFTSLLYLPLQLTIMTVIYFDLRARSEGLDLALQVSDPSADATTTELLPEAPQQPSMPLLTWIDLGRFTLVSFAGIAFYFLIISFVSLIGLLAL